MEASAGPRIDILASEHTRAAVLYGLRDLLAGPGQAWPFLVEGVVQAPLARVRIVAADGGPFGCLGGVPVNPEATLDVAGDADIVCVPNFTLPPGGDHAAVFRREIDWLRRRYDTGATIASVCSGAILLAEAGLLDGYEATSHWSATPLFRERFPQVDFRPEKIIAFAGEGNRIVLGGGMSSWQDIALYVIARFMGPEHAARMARIFCIETRAGGQLHYAAHCRQVQKEDAQIAECQVWLSDNYAAPDALGAMRDRSGLSRRSFDRRFRAATGYSPREYLHSLRVEEAKQMLEASQLSSEEISEAVGYADPRAFQRLFRKLTGLTPSSYRKRFSHSRFLAAG